MPAKAKRKKNTAYSTHEYQLTKVTPTGVQVELISVIGSRDAYHKQLEIEAEGFQVIVFNVTTSTEEFRSKGLTDIAL
jgi:hypothetical protein